MRPLQAILTKRENPFKNASKKTYEEVSDCFYTVIIRDFNPTVEAHKEGDTVVGFYGVDERKNYKERRR